MSPMENRTKSPGENLSVGGTTQQLAGGLISQEPQGENRCNGNDAVCFTAGFAGSMFGAGTIHAYLAADRKPPALVAGISMGAVNAVAMQRCYQELENVKNGSKAEREVARWTWFREYLTSLTDDPLGAIWRGLPRKIDLGADLPPIQDTSLEEFTDNESKEFLKDEEKRARRELYLFMRLGQWLARLPVKLSVIADFVVTYVRVNENVPGRKWRRKIKLVTYNPASLLVPVIWHLCLHPTWFYEPKFRRTSSKGKAKNTRADRIVRPLFGWTIFLAAWALFLPIVGATLLAAWGLYSLGILISHSLLGPLLSLAKDILGGAFNIALLFLVLWVLRTVQLAPAMALSGLTYVLYSSWQSFSEKLRKKGQPKRYPWVDHAFRWMSRQLFGGIELKRSLIHDFHLRLRLTRLFGKWGKSDELSETPMPVVLVVPKTK